MPAEPLGGAFYGGEAAVVNQGHGPDLGRVGPRVAMKGKRAGSQIEATMERPDLRIWGGR